jgi:hypothetical protein
MGKDEYRSVQRWLHDLRLEGQRDVTIAYRTLYELPAFGDCVTTLTLRSLPLNAINRLPPNLVYLTILDCPIHKFTCELPKTLRWLVVNNTFLKELPPLPPGLETLHVKFSSLASLPPLPSTLQTLTLQHAPLQRLNALPPHLLELRLFSLSHLSSVPAIPSSLLLLMLSELPIRELPEGYGTLVKRHPYVSFSVVDCCYLPQMRTGESIIAYAMRLWDAQERAAALRAAERARAIHEELAQVVWRPERIAAALEAGMEPEDL